MRLTARYVLVAGITAVGYFALLALGLLAGLHYFVAILVAQALTIVSAFPAYRRFVFESRSRVWLDFVRFLTVWGAGAVSGIVVTPLLVESVSWHPLVAQFVAMVAVGASSFLGHRFFSFRANDRRRRFRDEHDEST